MQRPLYILFIFKNYDIFNKNNFERKSTLNIIKTQNILPPAHSLPNNKSTEPGPHRTDAALHPSLHQSPAHARSQENTLKLAARPFVHGSRLKYPIYTVRSLSLRARARAVAQILMGFA